MDHHPGDRGARSLLLLGAVYAALLAFMWLVIPLNSLPLTLLGAIAILGFMVMDPVRRRERGSDLGVTGHHFAGAVGGLIGPTIVLLAALAILNRVSGVDPKWSRFVARFGTILPWALLQQGLLQATFNRRLSRVFGDGIRSAALTAVAFGGMHLPNPLLSAATTLTGLWWARVYQRTPDLYALTLCHALLSAAAQTLLPGSWTHGFRVGPGYFRWH